MSDQPNTPDEPQEPSQSAEPLPSPSPTAVPAVADASSWPTSATTTAVILALVAVLGVTGAIVGFARASSADDDKSALEVERDAATARTESAEQERDDAQEAVDALTAERDEAIADNEQLTSDLADETERAESAEATIAEARAAFEEVQAEIEATDSLLPVSIDSSLIPEDLVGDYDITFAEAYCDGFPTCGALPTADEARFYETPEGFLRVEVPGVLDAGLFALEGSLYGITDSFTALPQCDGVDQRARVTVTLYARGITIDAPEDEVTRTVDNLNASITIDAPRLSDACPSGLVFYASTFTPTG